MRFELFETVLMLLGAGLIVYTLALIIRGIFISARIRRQATYLKDTSPSGNDAEYEEASRRG